jgi:xylan 1,4-beta-xylosidase
MYLDLFANTFKGLKRADPMLRVGGPATAQLGWLDVFLEGAVKLGATPDFVSSHLYPTDPWAYEKPLPHGRDDFYHAIASAWCSF